jgi:hypothetical protein
MQNLPVAIRLALLLLCISVPIVGAVEVLRILWRGIQVRLFGHALCHANHWLWSWVLIVVATQNEMKRLEAGLQFILRRRMQLGFELNDEGLEFLEEEYKNQNLG